MHYELYVDSLLFCNLMMNLYVLFLTNISTLRTATPQRIWLGAIVGALGFLLPMAGLTIPVVGIPVGVLAGTVGMILFTFQVRSWKSFLCLLKHMLFYSFCLGGCLLFLQNLTPGFRGWLEHPSGMILAAGGICLLLYGIRRRGYAEEAVGTAKLQSGAKTVEVTALIDSGNSLVEPISGKAVCVIDRKIFEWLWGQEGPGFRVIPYRSVGKKKGLLKAYLLEELEMEYEGMLLRFYEVYVAVQEEDGAESVDGNPVKIIVNPMIFREKRNRKPKGRQNVRRNDFKSGNAWENAIQNDTKG